MSIVIKTDNTGEWLAAFESATEAALEAVGLTAVGHAAEICPKDTGRLAGSITHELDGKAVCVGTNVEYAPYVELGTSRMGAQPYLVPAAENHGSEYADIIKSHMEGA